MSETLSRRQLSAIWAAARARGIDNEGLHLIVDGLVGKKSLKLLTRAEAHTVLDKLNGKDPEREAAKRTRFTGPVARGERERTRTPRRHLAGQAVPGGDTEKGEGDGGKIVRFASSEQMKLIDEIAWRCGFTIGYGERELDRQHLENWLRGRFKLPKVNPRTGVPYVYTGQGAGISAGGAQKTISALRAFQQRRRELWQKHYGPQAAEAALALGVPYEQDGNLRDRGGADPFVVEAIQTLARAAASLTVTDGGTKEEVEPC